MMRSKILVFGVSVLPVIGFILGALYQKATNGYQYKLIEEKEYESSLGTVKWSCFSESVGFPFLDPEKTMIKVGNRIIYKAQRDFQEDNPYARSVEVSSNSISWEDGDFSYHLTMEEMTNQVTKSKQ